MSGDFFGEGFAELPVMGIFRGLSPERTVELCNAAWDVGVSLVEVPVMSPREIPVLEAAVAAGRDRGRSVGAGTILSADQLESVAAVGAAFTVAPGVDVDVLDRSVELGIPHLPGVATSTDIATAVSRGWGWVKAFPAAQLTPGWVRAQRGPFPRVRFVATGGITSGNAQAFLDAGCSAVAVGSALTDPDAVSSFMGLVAGGPVSERRQRT
ncbi:bifunctional 4-hydroxy-2-oxoglutarate aldolase/2-dehydro-3-deoxy-phosphogluconate aldolase [Microbacterium saperdae]|uniref:2-keto-3-deoxy-phosphogluconate aldolase n=1 Tax=Microbacterium saperdae TaxID=69368 RepID=A0A543BIL7_9MICO|nr:bifunctional 4-hydroxy-2-oxoglutarate aldolase/2-dehydro-3-deoxy-phosphogluconate aldolase [Microbacterium saperdae]TQL84700.1 2-keto-3-deoxy-phosphogluconate aldolase [Microbacterium saperdae]GGM64838.1 2-dehydro-3-deoxy-6-phosphogalactonate aldolase [Microbacterium saperdae]